MFNRDSGTLALTMVPMGGDKSFRRHNALFGNRFSSQHIENPSIIATIAYKSEKSAQ